MKKSLGEKDLDNITGGADMTEDGYYKNPGEVEFKYSVRDWVRFRDSYWNKYEGMVDRCQKKSIVRKVDGIVGLTGEKETVYCAEYIVRKMTGEPVWVEESWILEKLS